MTNKNLDAKHDITDSIDIKILEKSPVQKFFFSSVESDSLPYILYQSYIKKIENIDNDSKDNFDMEQYKIEFINLLQEYKTQKKSNNVFEFVDNNINTFKRLKNR